MDQLLLMGILQGVGNLLDVGDDGRQRQRHAFGMLATQGAVGGVVYHEEGDAILDIEVQDAHDMRVNERGNSLGLELEVLYVVGIGQLGVQDFDGGLPIESQVLSEVNFGEASTAQTVASLIQPL